MTKTKRTIITLLSLTGLALAIELCLVYYNANFAADAKPSICAINDMMDCDSVAKTPYSQFLGVPLALWGVCLYLFFLFMTFADKISNLRFLGFLKVFKNPRSYIFCISILSFCISMVLAGISVLKINSVCIFCFMTYFVDLLIAITAKEKGVSLVSDIKTSFKDFIDAVKVPNYLFAFGTIVLIGIAALVYTSGTDVLAPQMARLKTFRKAFDSSIPTEGNKMGNPEASLQIDEYMDFNCGGCFLAQVYLHRIMAEYDNVKVIQHQVPLDSECNPHIKEGNGHKNSCLKSRYALAAAKQGKYWQMGQALFEPDINEEKEIIDAARLLELDIKQLKEDAASQEIKKELEDMLKDADEKGIDGTPTIYIGMKKIVGAGKYQEFANTVREQGGIPKNGQQ